MVLRDLREQDAAYRPARGEKTKYRLADAMKICMQQTPVADITVRQIVETCGLTRQTFYRNFRDKYDLINWYFDKLLAASFDQMGSGKNILEGLTLKFRFIQSEALFFRAAFHYDEQNSLKEHDFKMIFAFYQDLIRRKTGRPPAERDSDILEMYCQSQIYMTVKWVLGGMKQSPEELAHLMLEAMPPRIETLFRELDLLA